MIYIVLEIQSTGESAAVLTQSYADNLEEALAKFFTVCAAAAKSSVPIHTVEIIDDQGVIVKSPEVFRHVVESGEE